MKKPEPARALKPALVMVLCAVLLALFLIHPKAERAPAAPLSPSATELRSSPRRRAHRASAISAREPENESSTCSSFASLRCHEGDVWSEDSCGQLEAKVEECGLQLCRDAACEEPDFPPCAEPSEGRCDGDVVRLCYAGRAQVVDCRARGLRCLQGEEGAECGPLLSPEERCGGGTRCEGDVLWACVAGRRERIDCKLLGGRCEALSLTESARCVQHKLGLKAEPECGACGCPPSSSVEQQCDGRDEDQDGRIDEGLSCAPVPIAAFVIGDDAGNGSFARDEIEAEIAHANALLANPGGEPALRFVLAELNVVPAAGLLDLSTSEFAEIASDPRFHPARDTFYVPVVFTDQLFLSGGVPRIGASTLPNGYCGGSRRGEAPPVGIIAIAKARASTTLLHELGHFLGLCHTHDITFGLQTVATDPARGALVLCEEPCNHEGDGMCDTPPDPGPEGCRYDVTCRTQCRHGEQPDAANLMSYYTLCRERFSALQLRTVEHTLALRRGWHACLTRDCPCELGGGECPAGMACRPTPDAQAKGSCALSGPRAPRSECQTHAQCAEGGVCLSNGSGASRCVRPCRESRAGCTCAETSLAFSVCREDLG